MPKIRGIKPELWTDENFVELSPFARLLWIGLWNHACDNGHLQDKPKQIKMRILPTDDVSCGELLTEIASQRLIKRVGGWITIPNLSHHQKPHKRWWTTCDKPGCELPEGASHAPANRGTTVAPPKGTSGTTADVDGEGESDGELKVMENSSSANAADAARGIRPDVVRLCAHLANHIENNGSKRPTPNKSWHDAARLLIDKDGRTEEQVRWLIDWCQDDEFWRSNILSMPKLREKFDQMLLKARPVKADSNIKGHMSLVQQLAAEEAQQQPTLEIGTRYDAR